MLLSDFSTLAEAKAHVAERKRMASPDMIISFLTKHDCVTSLQTSTKEKAKGFYLALLAGVQEFNLMNNHPVGQAQIQLLSYLVSVNTVNQAFYDEVFNYCNYTNTPFVNSTKHDFDKAKGNINKKLVTVENGYCTITTTADKESHNPQIYREVTFSNGDVEYIRVAGFGAVSTAKLYRVQCPSFPVMYVDDAYSVITQG
jgi:hypothetical protein